MLVDTDVLIWHLRGLPAAAKRLDELPALTISAITWLELLQGFRNRAEMAAAQKSLHMRSVKLLPVTAQITEHAIILMETFALSHHLHLGDALIAATALEHDLTVLTANTKHFSPINGLSIEAFIPRTDGSFSVHEPRVPYRAIAAS